MSNSQYRYTVYSSEHLLMAGEIAMLFNIRSKTDKHATNFVSAYLQDVVSSIPGYEQYYYTNRYGKDSRVYSAKTYLPIMTNLINSLEEEKLTTININEKNYTIKLGKR